VVAAGELSASHCQLLRQGGICLSLACWARLESPRLASIKAAMTGVQGSFRFALRPLPVGTVKISQTNPVVLGHASAGTHSVAPIARSEGCKTPRRPAWSERWHLSGLSGIPWGPSERLGGRTHAVGWGHFSGHDRRRSSLCPIDWTPAGTS
jgi:hypothetical protein